MIPRNSSNRWMLWVSGTSLALASGASVNLMGWDVSLLLGLTGLAGAALFFFLLGGPPNLSWGSGLSETLSQLWLAGSTAGTALLSGAVVMYALSGAPVSWKQEAPLTSSPFPVESALEETGEIVLESSPGLSSLEYLGQVIQRVPAPPVLPQSKPAVAWGVPVPQPKQKLKAVHVGAKNQVSQRSAAVSPVKLSNNAGRAKSGINPAFTAAMEPSITDPNPGVFEVPQLLQAQTQEPAGQIAGQISTVANTPPASEQAGQAPQELKSLEQRKVENPEGTRKEEEASSARIVSGIFLFQGAKNQFPSNQPSGESHDPQKPF
ncbi:MAG: hypothetical protein HY402_07080 [Elusimicrobia bacterium]|nr:hypothetical protein [Elusimicrobiota bacterium]